MAWKIAKERKQRVGGRKFVNFSNLFFLFLDIKLKKEDQFYLKLYDF